MNRFDVFMFLVVPLFMAGVFTGLMKMMDNQFWQAMNGAVLVLWIIAFGYGFFFVLPAYLMQTEKRKRDESE